MLHKVNLPSCVPELERIVEFQRMVLRFACEGQYAFPLDEDKIKNLFGNDIGEWFWKKFYTQPTKRDKDGNLPAPKKTTIHNSLQELTQHYLQTPQEGVDTLAAFDNDIRFADSLDDPDFRFQYPNLTETNRNLIKPLMVAFYEDLLISGFVEAIHGDTEKLDRDGFIASFWRNNEGLKTCPACDRERSDVILKRNITTGEIENLKIYSDADHFLPKSKYPFLSLHPFNLFPLCIPCNRSFKVARDIIDKLNDAPLVNIFHPYLRPVLEHLDLKVYRDGNGVSLGEFTDTIGMPSRRMNNLNRVFRLNDRWIQRLRDQKENILSNLRKERRKHIRKGTMNQFDENELKMLLIEEQEDTLERYGKNPGFIVQNSYLSCALNDSDEFEELYKHFAGI